MTTTDKFDSRKARALADLLSNLTLAVQRHTVLNAATMLRAACVALEEREKALDASRATVANLRDAIDTPQTDDFLEAVKMEAAHQVERWGEDDRAKKDDLDWLWLIVYLAGKTLFGKVEKNSETTIARHLADEAARTASRIYPKYKSGEGQKKHLHRIITIAAAALNWHRNRWPGKSPEIKENP